MSNFYNSEASATFINSAASRETDEQIMKAIAFHSESLNEAVNTWEEGLGNWSESAIIAFMETATNNHALDPVDLQWGEQTLADAAAQFLS